MDAPEALVSVTAVGLRNGVKSGSKGNKESEDPVSIKNEWDLQPILALS